MRIPHILVGGQRFYERKEIKDMVSYLRLTLNPDDDTAFRRVVNVPARGIGPKTIEIIEAEAVRSTKSLLGVISEPAFRQTLPVKPRQMLGSLASLFEVGRDLSQSGQITPVLKHILSESGYVDELRAVKTDENQSRLENLQEFVNVTTQFDNDLDAEHTLSSFLEGVALHADTDALMQSGDAVTLMTLHSSKGLEFPVVHIMGMEEGVFPHSRALRSDTEIDEERRLCYVGMTRAREELKLSSAQRRTVFGQPNFNPRSRFLDDIPRPLLDTARSPSMDVPDGHRTVTPLRTGGYSVVEGRRAPSLIEEKEEAPSGWTPPFRVGEKVSHAKFGIGVVVSCAPVSGDSEVTVAFPGAVGVKKMVQRFAKLEKVG
jgi:DNA helicase-2/ATP-dependent DNA helicase PcrA